MKLRALFLSFDQYGANAGRYTGTAEFMSNSGKVEINLNSALSEKILSLCAEGIVDSAKELATCIVQEAIVGQLEHTPDA